ncbi:hypothetical protein B0H19DRAFT_1080337 [Mycena capillaripes]|nr:hypothetical protein B0H19DRAFT_1080337 [Mycena capillaripes]
MLLSPLEIIERLQRGAANHWLGLKAASLGEKFEREDSWKIVRANFYPFESATRLYINSAPKRKEKMMAEDKIGAQCHKLCSCPGFRPSPIFRHDLGRFSSRLPPGAGKRGFRNVCPLFMLVAQRVKEWCAKFVFEGWEITNVESARVEPLLYRIVAVQWDLPPLYFSDCGFPEYRAVDIILPRSGQATGIHQIPRFAI